MKTITCTELADLILDFVGEELDPDQRTVFEQHLCGCTDCVVTVELYRATVTVGRALKLTDHQLPTAFEAKLRAALEAEGFC